MNTFFWVL